MGNIPTNEHEFRASVQEDVYYPAHAPRVETPTFRKTKRDGLAAGAVCAISGAPTDVEFHHFFCEAALTNAVDWAKVRGIGTGEITEVQAWDPLTGARLVNSDGTPRMVKVENLMVWMITTLARLRGFDWQAFDPAMPETFIDGPQNMLVLNKFYHRAHAHGIHRATFPVFIFQAFPRVPGFVFMPDELAHIHRSQV